MPVTGGRLCAKKLFDRSALRELQTDFYEIVGKKYGLKRGKEGSTAKHLDTVAFKTKKMTEAAEEKIREAEESQTAAKPVKELLESYESARSEKIPFSGKKKETEIIALRTKNSELEKRNNVLTKDNGDLYDELKRKKNGDNKRRRGKTFGKITRIRARRTRRRKTSRKRKTGTRTES